MRVSHYLILVAFLCGSAGLLLEQQVLNEQSRLERGRSSLEATTLLGRDASRIADNTRTLLTVADLVFGAQETYLLSGAQKQLRDLQGLQEAAERKADNLHSNSSEHLQSLGSYLGMLGAELDRYAALQEPPTEQEQFAVLAKVDQITASLVLCINELLQAVEQERLLAINTVAEEKQRTSVVTRLAVAGYVAFVLLVLVWASRRVGAPIRRLQRLAADATIEGKTFEPPVAGPVEVQALTRNLSKLVDSLQQELQRSKAITDAIPDALVVADLEKGITYYKPADESPAETQQVDITRWRFLSLLAEEEIRHIDRHMQLCVSTNTTQQFSINVPSATGNRSLEARASPCGDGRVVVVLRDLTDKIKAEHRIQRLAFFDSLTGLLNRASATQQIADHIAHTETASQPFALAFIDVDRFKHFNDTQGHDFGDQVLSHIARQIMGCVRFDPNRPFSNGRECDLPARIGGDEFMLMLRGVDTEAEALSIMERLLSSISAPVEIEGQRIEIGVSIGMSLYPQYADTLSELHFQSDMAMYEAKRAGGLGCRIYTERMGNRTRKRLSMEGRLKQALENELFYLEYQPQIDLTSGTIVGVEALLRWEDDGKAISPGEFIPIAEDSGLIVPIGDLVTRRAAQQVLQWQEQGVPFGRVHINVSAEQFSQTDFAQSLVQTLEQYHVALSSFGVEVTETVVVQDFERATNVLTSIRESGILISMDDFGTGYSSLNYLKHLPLDVLKIDRSFLRDLDLQSKEIALVRTIVQLGHELEMQVLAEGVETVAQYELLRRAKCDQAQGFLISRPLKPSAYADFAAANSVVDVTVHEITVKRA